MLEQAVRTVYCIGQYTNLPLCPKLNTVYIFVTDDKKNLLTVHPNFILMLQQTNILLNKHEKMHNLIKDTKIAICPL